jgi:hypothetical protein
MAKKSVQIAKTAETDATAETAAPATKVAVIQVQRQPAKAFRTGSARDLYWLAVQAHNGKPVAELAASVKAAPPSVPGRGKLAGQPEPLSGWLSWFAKQGLITIA